MAFGRMNTGKQRMSEINVTPLVDVMLVLLIVFMITAPLLTQAVKVNLPSAASLEENVQKDPIEISISAKGEWAIGDEVLTLEQVKGRMISWGQSEEKNRAIHVKADKEVKYEVVVKLLSHAQQQGLSKIALVTQKE